MRLRTTTALAALLAAGVAPVTLSAPASAATGPYTADFNGDGHADAVAPSPNASTSGKWWSGAVGVVYGSSAGVGRTASVSQNSTGVPGSAEESDGFGQAVAVGDLDKDGYSDLAVGAPQEQVGDDVSGGTVVIVWGSPTGLKGATTVKDPAVSGHDRWGQALAIGDFTGDGRPDLAVGASGTTQWIVKGGFTRSGTTGANISYTTSWTGSTGVLRLTAGKIDTDARADLLLGGRTRIASERNLDHTYLYFGTASAPTKKTELPYGKQLAVGDIDKDGYGDIVTGETQTATGGDLETPGPAVVSHGTASGVGAPEALTDSGRPSLGDIDGDGRLDLALGHPDDSGIKSGNGTVLVQYGGADGFGTPTRLTQDTPGIPGAAEDNDFFGTAVLLTDLTGDGRADLLAGSDGENEADGLVHHLKGTATGLTTSGSAYYGPSAFAIPTAYDPSLGGVLVG
ncbi:FG-GAP repeat protein [Streptomyces sp. NPDC005907]|uniref:FG-GAP repeat protein n=1 Tax=Streptomyces sp. NPDC005907 TaxID=3154571 RepID=UPI0033E9E1F0